MKKNKLNINYWLRKLYTTRLFQYLPINKSLLKKKIFTSIYKSKHWVQNPNDLSNQFISVSGPGSNTYSDQYKNLIKNFYLIIDKYEIKSIIDIPCGDFLWIKKIIHEKKIKYLGVDIVEELIKENKSKYQNENINFSTGDIVSFEIKEKYDLILVRDLLIHLDNIDIIKILNNLKKMNVKYLAINNYEINKNKDVIIGQHRQVNILIEPYNFPRPIFSFNDHAKDKFIYIYDISKIK
tara:strand:- start:141 stop:854 length:714 start_codon:yes stop_codon:yes gene_type:complete